MTKDLKVVLYGKDTNEIRLFLSLIRKEVQIKGIVVSDVGEDKNIEALM